MMAERGEPGRQLYSGIWAVLAGWFRVPRQPPTLHVEDGERVGSFRPARGFLDYLKLQFWLGLLVVDLALAIAWIAILVQDVVAALALAPLFLVAMFVPDVVAYVALHLRYDTTWYVMSSRSLRIRRGIWVIRETTITFENVQNVELKQGPLQRHFGIANLTVQTAGGGQSQQGQPNPHVGLIEGVDDAVGIRDVIMRRVRRSRRAGLGDDAEYAAETAGSAAAGWTPAHLAALRDIRNLVQRLGA
jgi:membrane protein YdbS with pleckstrin-like domain